MLDQAHHEVGGAGLAPVVVERDDVRVFEPGDELGLGLEPADERRVVGELGRDHLDRHLAPDDRLVGAIDGAERAATELLAQLVAAHRQPRVATARSLAVGVRSSSNASSSTEDLLLQVADRARRIDADLGDEPLAERGEGAKSLGGSAAPVQRQHQRGDEPLAQRMLTDQALQLGDELAGQPQPQVGFDRSLGRLQAELLETGDLGLGPRLVGELLEGVTPPQGEAVAKHRRGRRRIGLGDEPRLGNAPLEPSDIGVVAVDRHHVARASGQQNRAL